MNFFKYLTNLAFNKLIGRPALSEAGYMISTATDSESGKMENTNYSPYYEFEYLVEDCAVLVRLLITLGQERLPPEFQNRREYAQEMKELYRDGIIEWVTEVYIFNLLESEIEIQPLYVKVDNSTKPLDQRLSISASSFAITAPMVHLHSVYGTQSNVEFTFECNGKTHEVSGIAKRKTVDEINNRYSI